MTIFALAAVTLGWLLAARHLARLVARRVGRVVGKVVPLAAQLRDPVFGHHLVDGDRVPVVDVAHQVHQLPVGRDVLARRALDRALHAGGFADRDQPRGVVARALALARVAVDPCRTRAAGHRLALEALSKRAEEFGVAPQGARLEQIGAVPGADPAARPRPRPASRRTPPSAGCRRSRRAISPGDEEPSGGLPAAQAGAFFGAGAALLTSMLLFLAAWLRTRERRVIAGRGPWAGARLGLSS
jgi:hypothetical protein